MMKKINVYFAFYILVSLIVIVGLLLYGPEATTVSLLLDIKIFALILLYMALIAAAYLLATWLIDKLIDIKNIARVDIRLKDDGIKLKAKGKDEQILGILFKGMFAVADELGISKDRLLITLHDAARVDEEEASEDED
ncbi:hypothetical protein [Ligilactobacillus agilis]|uniref:hypothetical protein n=1 Tax=Ligilactobacillus agilis TaxID=1601 RepID=UPI00067F54E6|nr:hypothetical protein [Ligilactobacillus agilis]